MADERTVGKYGDIYYCSGGKPIYDKKGAQTAKNLRMKRDHVPLRIYNCPKCNGWHLTSSYPYRKTYVKKKH